MTSRVTVMKLHLNEDEARNPYYDKLTITVLLAITILERESLE